jgi:ribosomal protein S19
MRRSKWKGPYINLNDFFSFIKENKKTPIIISRNLSIIPKFIDNIFKVHTGNSYVEVLVTGEMIGHKFGEFVATRKMVVFKHKKKKKRKKR